MMNDDKEDATLTDEEEKEARDKRKREYHDNEYPINTNRP